MIVLVWILCGVAAGMIGSRKGEGCLAFIIGMIFGPFGILFAALSHGNRVSCPFCREWIDPDAVVCPRCQRDQPAAPPPQRKPRVARRPWWEEL